MGTAGDFDESYANSIARDAKFKELGTDEQFDAADVSMEKYETKERRLAPEKREEFARSRAIAQHNKYEMMLQKCWFCFDSPARLTVLKLVPSTS